MPYTFPGITPYIEKAAEKLGLACPEQLHRAKSGPHLKVVVDALSQLPGQVEMAKAGRIDPKAPAAALERATLVRDGLAVQLRAIDDAIADVAAGLGLDAKPEDAKPKRRTRKPKADADKAEPEATEPEADGASDEQADDKTEPADADADADAEDAE